MHTMHAVGLAPKKFTASTGEVLRLNKAQDYLADCWKHFCSQLPPKIDLLFLNGDIVEGQNPAEHARELVEVDPLFQERGAVELLKPLARRVKKAKGRTYVTKGSRYHSGRAAFLDELLGGDLNAQLNWKGHHSRAWVNEDYLGVHWDVAHRQSYTIRYRVTPMEREVGFYLERLARKRKEIPETIVMVRSHTHVGFRLYQEEGITFVSTPCWKLQDDFAQTSISPNRLYPDNLGSVGFEIHDKGKRVHAIPYLYEHLELT